MRVKLRNRYDDKYEIDVKLPAESLELYDILDRLDVKNKFGNVYIRIDKGEERIPPHLRDSGFYDDIFRLNLFTARLESLSDAEAAGFTAVLLDKEDYNITDLLLVTYGIQTIPIYPCKNFAEYGEVVIDNDMLPEVENCPDELIPYLDKELIGRLAVEKFGGVFIGHHYCETAGYEQPDIEFTISKPDRRAFQVLAGKDDGSSQWYTLPCDNSTLEKISDMHCIGIRSPLPGLLAVSAAGDVRKLNDLAVKIAELSDDDFVKLKAAIECKSSSSVSGITELISQLDCFDLDRTVYSAESFSAEYLKRNLPENSDISVFGQASMWQLGNSILERKDGFICSYGAVCKGHDLYSPIVVSTEQEQSEDNAEEESEDESEDHGMNMGGIS